MHPCQAARLHKGGVKAWNSHRCSHNFLAQCLRRLRLGRGAEIVTHPVRLRIRAQPGTPLRCCQSGAHVWEVRVAPQQPPASSSRFTQMQKWLADSGKLNSLDRSSTYKGASMCMRLHLQGTPCKVIQQNRQCWLKQ